MHDRLLGTRPGPDLRSARNHSLDKAKIGKIGMVAAQMERSGRTPFAGVLLFSLASAICPARVFAQGVMDQLAVPEPPALPTPPLFERYVLEQPWYAAAAVVILAVIVAYAMQQNGKKRGSVVVAAGACLAAIALGLGTFIETPREKVSSSARRLVDAVANVKLEQLDAELGRTATLDSPGIGHLERSEISDAVNEYVGRRFPIKECKIIALQASQDGANVGRVQLKVRAVPKEWGFPHFSWWVLDYREDGGVWRVTGIRYIAGSMDPPAR